MSTRVRVDLHVHTDSSPDCCTVLEDFEAIFESGVIDKIAITDHSIIGLAYDLKKRFGDRIIVGEEIMTTGGEIIGLFLEKEIQKHLSPEDTIHEIRKQNGVIYIPHPFDYRRSGIQNYENYEAIMKDSDIIEVFNSRCLVNTPNEKAENFAKEQGILMAAASDAHGPKDIGTSYIEINDFKNVEDFLLNMRDAVLVKNKMTVRGFFSPTKSRIQKRFYNSTSSS